MRLNFRHGGKAEIGQTGQFADFDFVHVVVATQQQEPYLSFDNFAFVVFGISSQNEGFDGVLQRQTQQFSHISTGGFARCRGFGHGLRADFASCNWCSRFGLFHVGGVVAAGAVDDGVFTGGGDDLEFFAQIATNRAAVGSYSAVGQAETVKNLAVGTRP